ncbi:MAG: cytochrome c family protein [Proteobacteria bacterium]|nr:cytochrome c family protein [Pseudomonadota bacterium]
MRSAGALLAVFAACTCRAQDASAGKAVFAQCSVCHSVDGSSSVGPSLKGIVGRKAGSATGFRYSRGMRNSNLVWDAATLDRYLADPQGAIPGNLMPFAGLADKRARADLIAYLASLK